jgi:hypothetical protein
MVSELVSTRGPRSDRSSPNFTRFPFGSAFANANLKAFANARAASAPSHSPYAMLCERVGLARSR